MANYVTISTIGHRPPTMDPDAGSQRVVSDMIVFWKGRLEQVLPDKPDLIVLPEACDRPAAYPEERLLDLYQARGHQVQEFFAKTARQHQCHIAYSAVREAPPAGTWRNSTVILDRRGEVAGTYNKNHLVIEEHTKFHRLYGKDAAIVPCDFGRVGCAICFDLNFDELRLKYVKLRPDLLLFSSMYHGGLMQSYWAYSCRCHFVGAVANDPSAIIAPTGQVLASTTSYHDFVTARVNLDCELVHLNYNWERFTEMKRKYGPEVRITDPGYLASVLVSCEAEDLTVADMLREFEVETLDDYFRRALAHRHEPGHIEP